VSIHQKANWPEAFNNDFTGVEIGFKDYSGPTDYRIGFPGARSGKYVPFKKGI